MFSPFSGFLFPVDQLQLLTPAVAASSWQPPCDRLLLAQQPADASVNVNLGDSSRLVQYEHTFLFNQLPLDIAVSPSYQTDSRHIRQRCLLTSTSLRHNEHSMPITTHRSHDRSAPDNNASSTCAAKRSKNDFGHSRRGIHGEISSDMPSKCSSSADSGAADVPLYCRLCRVKLNAARQARQHFTGKTHTRKAQLVEQALTDTDSTRRSGGDNATGEQSRTSATLQELSTIDKSNNYFHQQSHVAMSSSTANTIGQTITNPSRSNVTCSNDTSPCQVAAPLGACDYCPVCGMAFNSDRQAWQHYRGKLHAKKLRLDNYMRHRYRHRHRAISLTY